MMQEWPKTMATKTKKTPKKTKTAVGARRIAVKAFAVRMKLPADTAQYAVLRKNLGLSQKTFAQLVSSSQRAVARWEAGAKPGELGKRALVELQRLQKALMEIMKKDFIPQWLESPNKALGNFKPLEVIERGEIDRIWSLIYYLKSGEPY
jgi:DNA-binding transcriptional regulator YiaG